MPDLSRLTNRVLGRVERWRRRHELRAFADSVAGARALEIGGPSAIFARGGLLALYDRLAGLDAVNYAERTLWDGAAPATPSGRFIVAEATDLTPIGDGEYDALLASHVIEHVANPLRALGEWKRVVRPGGRLVIVVPHRDHTFDHRRPVTAVEHLIADAEAGTGEDDLTHLDEILALHDLGRDPEAGSREAFEARCRANAEHRGMHHHVFVADNVAAMLEHAGWRVEQITTRRPYHIAALARHGD